MKPGRQIVEIALLSALLMAALEFLYTIAGGHTEIGPAIAASAVIFVFALVTLLVLLMVASVAISRLRVGIDRDALLVALAVAVTVMFILKQFFAAAPAVPYLLIRLLQLTIIAGVTSAAWFLTRSLDSEGRPRAYLLAIVFALPFLVFESGVVALFVAEEHLGVIAGGILAIIVAALTLWICASPTIRRRRVIISAIGGTALALSGTIAILSAGQLSAPKDRGTAADHPVRRVILVTVDTLRADAVSASGEGRVETPNIDALAADGAIFTRARSPAPWTLPGFASMMTGLPPTVHNAEDYQSVLDERFVTLAELMYDAGYLTAALTTNSMLGPAYHLAQGFEVNRNFPGYSSWHTIGANLLRWITPNSYRTDVTTAELTDLASEWLEVNRDRDFFLWVHYLDPHLPYDPPSSYLQGMQPVERVGTNFQFKRVWDIRRGQLVLSQAEQDWVRDLYDAEVRYVDDNVGRLLSTMRELGLYDESLIIFSSDHGEEFWEHGGFEHGHSLYDELLRVPLIIKPPASKKSVRITTPVSVQAIFATVLDFCGIDHQSNPTETSSLIPLIEEGDGGSTEPMIAAGVVHYEPRQAVVDGDTKYIRGLVFGEEQLFDLRSDPGEQDSVADVRTEIVDQARALLDSQIELAVSVRDELAPPRDVLDGSEEDMLEALKAVGYVDE